MFGLMKPIKCTKNPQSNFETKLNYCGVCKSIGTKYSQKSRLLLNNDIVFLGELLSAIAKENIFDWSPSYQAKSCFNMPKANSIPLSLEFTGTLNIILASLTFEDKISDSKKLKYFWIMTKSVFSKDLKKAKNQMGKWGIDLKHFLELTKIQKKRETSELNNEEKNLAYYSEPTSIITATSFKEGVKLIGKQEDAEKMYSLGYYFGKLVYLLDALEDFSKDYKNKHFNPIRLVYNTANKEQLDETIRNKVLNEIKNTQNEVNMSLNSLNINDKLKKYFIHRLSSNLNKRFGLASIQDISCLKVNGSKKDENFLPIDLSKKDEKNTNKDINKTKKSASNCAGCIDCGDLCCLCDNLSNCCDVVGSCDAGCCDAGCCDCCSACDCSC